MIYSFAGIDHTSQGGLQAIGAAVAQSEGVSRDFPVVYTIAHLTLCRLHYLYL